VGHRVVASSGAGPSGFIDGHDLSEIMTILGGRAVRMFLPFFETDAADNTPVQDAGPRGHHFLKVKTSTYDPYIKGHVLAYRLNAANFEAFDMADHDDFSMGADGTPANEPAFSVGIAVRFKDATLNRLITRIDTTGGSEKVEYRFITDGSDRLIFQTFDAELLVNRGRRWNTALVEDTWHILIGTYTGACTNGGFSIYVGGARVDNQDQAAGDYTAMHNMAVPTRVGCYDAGGGALGGFINGDVWGPFITKKCLSAGEALSLTNIYRRVLCL